MIEPVTNLNTYPIIAKNTFAKNIRMNNTTKISAIRKIIPSASNITDRI